MAKYFNYFPKVYYFKENSSTNLDVVTNLTSRFGFQEEFKTNSSVYYEYEIQDGDTPEIIASKYYDSPERHWLVLLFNDILNPQFDWPLDQRTLISYINDKYSSNANTANGQTGLSWASSTIKEYVIANTIIDLSTDISTETKIYVDSNTYSNIATSNLVYTLSDNSVIRFTTQKETLSYYQFEIEENENRRKIKLLKPEFVYAVEEEFKKVISNART